MKGTVLHYNEAEQSGIIKNDETRFAFTLDEFKSDGKPRQGMAVDFIEEEGKATEIYKDVSESDIQDKIGDLQDLDFVQKAKELFTNGLHNKNGLIVSGVALLCLFFPIITIKVFGVEQSASLVDTGYGKLAFALLVVSCALFYGGAKRLYLKVVNTIVAVLFLIGVMDVTSSIGSANGLASAFKAQDIASTSWGLYIGVMVVAGLLYMTYLFNPYEQNDKTF